MNSMKFTSMNGLSEGMAKFLAASIEAGFEYPLLVTAVAVNGSMMFSRYTPTNGENTDDGLDCKVLARHYEGAVFKLPINVMLTDSNGQAARMLIRKPGEPEFFWSQSPTPQSH